MNVWMWMGSNKTENKHYCMPIEKWIGLISPITTFDGHMIATSSNMQANDRWKWSKPNRKHYTK